MAPALWLLLRLRFLAQVRRWGRSLRTTKGVLLTLVCLLLFLPWLVLSVVSPRVQLGTQLELIRRHGPLGLLAFTLLNIILSSEERAVYFSPAEVDFLFPGPFPRRQLLVYRMAGEAGSSLLTASLLTFLFAHHANAPLPAFVGLFLMIELMVLISLAAGLVISTMGALAFNRRRRLLLLGTLALLASALLPLGRRALALDPLEGLDRLERSTAIRVMTFPFRPPILAFTAGRLWPELVVSSLMGLGVILALAASILVLHAEYYEATAAAGAKTYARLLSHRIGRPLSRPVKSRRTLPPLPWWGGIGPNLWRQSLTATRHPDRFLCLLAYLFFPMVPILLVERGLKAEIAPDSLLTLGIVASMSLSASLIVGFDFRSDIDRMDLLKSLPIPAASLVIGQLGVPVLMLTLAQATCILTVDLVRGASSPWPEALFALPPFNALLVETEAILLLWFPIRVSPGSTMAFTVMARQLLLLFAKIFMVTVVGGLVAALSAAVYYLLVASKALALIAAGVSLAGFDLALIPLVVLAYQQYDVVRDCPP